ncbi:c2h2 type zinc finger protein [Colletotrichum incanum]|uniref:C2h2 type zinc finger protein n=1 Tax=Colletotrichum incanum TaxID=1573173 RepID=A0A167BMB6_COLIC|nr:c2h2 type zinc finger protein [Colletotrichum incanum]
MEFHAENRGLIHPSQPSQPICTSSLMRGRARYRAWARSSCEPKRGSPVVSCDRTTPGDIDAFWAGDIPAATGCWESLVGEEEANVLCDNPESCGVCVWDAVTTEAGGSGALPSTLAGREPHQDYDECSTFAWLGEGNLSLTPTIDACASGPVPLWAPYGPLDLSLPLTPGAVYPTRPLGLVDPTIGETGSTGATTGMCPEATDPLYGHPEPPQTEYTCNLMEPVETLGSLPNKPRLAARCPFPGCASKLLFTRQCDLTKHYKQHFRRFFCRAEGCSMSASMSSNAKQAGLAAGFSTNKDRLRHEKMHNPSVVCEQCGRLFSREDNYRDHFRRLHSRA